ncbi:MAG: hypothetical protein AAF497_20910 [Planctomycetota bacterium]
MSSLELASAKYFDDVAASSGSPVQMETKSWMHSLTLICFLCLLFGLWGMGTSALGIVGIMNGVDGMIEKLVTTESASIAKEVAALNSQYRTPRIFALAVSFILGVMLVAVGAMLWCKVGSARSTAITIFGSVIGFHVCMAILTCVMFVSASSMIKDSARQKVAAHQVSGEKLESVTSHIMGDMTFFMLVGACIGVLIKGAIYGAMILHLNTPYVRALYGENPYPEYDEMRQKVESQKFGTC